MVIKDYAEAKNDDAGPLVLDNGEKGIEIRVGSERKQPRPGAAKGILYGGCLSLIAASLGTPYEVKTKNCILFLEDINAKPYQVDRMLMQLKYAGKLAEVRAAVFGEMVGCVQPGGQDYTLQEIVARVLSDLEIPVAFGLPSGHVSAPPNYSLPLGSMVELKVTADDFLLRSTGSGD
jgi:muramoyltetrapeptide carboxypeptidase